MPKMITRRAALALVGAGATAAALHPGDAAAQSLTLLNVSYDPTRELYQDFNAAFIKHWKEKAGETLTIADVSLYPYTRTAPDAGFDLGRFPGIRAWLARLEARPRWLTPAALAASHGSLLGWSKRVLHGV